MRVAATLATLAVSAVCWAQEGGMTTIQEVKVKHQRQLLALPGVVSVGIGRGEDGKPALIVGLDRPRAETLKQLPVQLEGFSIRTEIVGTPRAQ